MHRSGPVLRVLVPLGLGLLAFAVRALGWPTVFAGPIVQLAGADAWYHMRRIAYALRNAPDTLGFDPFLNFPHGARAIWPPFFDAATASALRLLVGADVAAAERIVAWLPPLLGALTVVVFYGFMRRHFGTGAAAIGGVFLCLSSGSSWYARVGMLDHHVAVALVGAGILGAGMALLSAFERRDGVVWGWAVGVGLLFAGMLHVWPGGLLHVVLLEVGLAGYGLARTDRAEAVRFAFLFSGIQAVAFATLVLAGWPPTDPWGPWGPTVLSRFQPLVFGALGASSLACALLWHATGVGANRVGRSGQAVGIALCVASVVLAGVPALPEGLADAWTWLGRGERFQGSVLESRPLLFPDGDFDTRLASLRLSRFFFLLPAAWVFLVIRELRGARRPAFLLLCVAAVGLPVAALLQARFFNSAAVPVAAFLGLSVVSVDEACLRSAPGGLRHAGRVALVAGVLWLWWPATDAYRADLSNQLPALRGDPIAATPADRYFEALLETATWLREHTPSAGDAYAPGVEPSYGVLGHWQYGHLVLYVAERPTVVGNFGDDLGGDNYRRSFEYFGLTEARAVELLDELRVRYVLIRPLDVARADLGPGSMIRRLADPHGGGLARHRLVFERRVLRQAEEGPRSHFRVFERVAGAVVVGRAEPGAIVEARLPYASPTGRRGEFQRQATANQDGVYRLRLPYATRDGPASIPVAQAWRVGVAGEDAPRHPVVTPEPAVVGGARIEGPDLRR